MQKSQLMHVLFDVKSLLVNSLLQNDEESQHQGFLFIHSIKQSFVQSNRIEEMRLQKKPALRRNYSQEKIVKPKDYSLPALIKQHELASTSHIPKRYNLEPFKLRINNAQQKRPASSQETPIQQKKPQIELVVSQVKEKDVIQNVMDKQTPISNAIIQNIFEAFQKAPRTQLKKRKTLAYGEFLYLSEQSNDSSNQSVAESSEEQQGEFRRKTIKRLSRKFSLVTIPTTNTTEVKEVGVAEKRSNFCTKQTKKQMQRVHFYYDFLRQQAQLHDLNLSPVNSYEDQTIHYSLGQGNNRQMIKDCMNRRWWWKEAQQEKGELVNFLWTQLKDLPFIIKNERANYQVSSNESIEEVERHNKSQQELEVAARTLHNHFENNKYLGSKLSLYLSLKSYCHNHNMPISETMLPTFYVCRFMDDEWKSFTKAYFQRLQISRIDNWDVNINKKYWMVKQIGEGESSNRVFTTYKEIKQHVEKQCRNGSRFLIQKYISRPFLFKRRKFDIRTYALIVRLKNKLNVYLHKEGVISTATELFDMIEIDNPLVHITTQAVQITSKKFGEFEPGNKIDFPAFQSYLDGAFGDRFSFMGQAFPRMQQAVALFARANSARLAQSKQNSCFQLVQCEFSMDQDFRPWLIDVHTNPVLDTYCVVLERILPSVIEDTLKHTVDVLFPPPLEWPESKRHLLNAQKDHPDGFELIFEEGKEGEQRREAKEIEGVQSERDVYMDDLLIDDSQNGQCSHLTGIEYLLNQGIERY